MNVSGMEQIFWVANGTSLSTKCIFCVTCEKPVILAGKKSYIDRFAKSNLDTILVDSQKADTVNNGEVHNYGSQ